MSLKSRLKDKAAHFELGNSKVYKCKCLQLCLVIVCFYLFTVHENFCMNEVVFQSLKSHFVYSPREDYEEEYKDKYAEYEKQVLAWKKHMKLRVIFILHIYYFNLILVF